MNFSPIANEKLSDKVVKVITDQVKSGALKPGDRLPSEPELAAALQVSRGILREALTVLQDLDSSSQKHHLPQAEGGNLYQFQRPRYSHRKLGSLHEKCKLSGSD